MLSLLIYSKYSSTLLSSWPGLLGTNEKSVNEIKTATAFMVLFIQLGKTENMMKTPENGQVNVTPLVKVLCSKEYQKSSEKTIMTKVL